MSKPKPKEVTDLDQARAVIAKALGVLVNRADYQQVFISKEQFDKAEKLHLRVQPFDDGSYMLTTAPEGVH